jgi:hypothetical protein
MAQTVRGTAGRRRRAPQRLGRNGTLPSTCPREPLAPAKQRIAEALAAVLVAHYRREQERAERERVPRS